jgi:hypothetical protein
MLTYANNLRRGDMSTSCGVKATMRDSILTYANVC